MKTKFLSALASLRGDASRLFVVNSLTAMSYSLIMPIMSYFLIKHLQAPPSYIGIYTIATALSGILLSQFLGGLLDRGKSGLPLFTISMTAALLAGIAFANVTNFWQALVVGVVLMGCASASFPLMLAMIRSYADSSGKNSVALNSQMRSGVSLVWIIGPTIAFTAVDWFGFSANFYLSAMLCLLVIVMAWTCLPKATTVQKSASTEQPKVPLSLELWLLGAVMLVGNLANTLYLTALPLYLTEELALPVSLPGMLMGLTAGLEIPIMLLVPRWAGRFGHYRMFTLGFGFALLFYIGMQFAESPLQLFALQALNAIYFGIFAGLGISLIQDAATARLGFASAFYTNAMRSGMMAGTALAGLLAQYWGFKHAMLGSIAAALVALALMAAVAWLRRSSNCTDCETSVEAVGSPAQ
ncbi:sugar efflux transporter [Neiella sp. HB171785]|uniref:Sugar efflux transporter n=1 Tax=Neiella litorisoli TaxID=2771431 RepID=A0A8J6UFV8_9GAMM|nr:sugar efflux transporter [Neiella litorisoli]MBD1391319.1 sugar efflux transporter [Neiella litorisoli]